MKRILYSILTSFLFLSSVSLFAQSSTEGLNENTGIKAINHATLVSIYPQPSTGPINIGFSEAQDQDPKVILYDILGNLIYTNELERINGTTFKLDLSDKKPGYYFIKIESDNGTTSRRITLKS